MTIRQLFYAALMPVKRIYWHVFKPKTFGVKVLIIHPTKTSQVLLVRHSYGNKLRWNIPGGGYKPKKESAKAAAKREIFEELGVAILQIETLGEYLTTREGKRDTVTMFKGTIENPTAIKTNPEISELKWTESNLLGIRENDLSGVARRAVEIAFPVTP